MRINITNTNNKYLNLKIYLIIFCSLFSFSIYAQGFTSITQISDITGSQQSGEKPQSKVWKYSDKWYAVFPVAANGIDEQGSWLWRLDGSAWTKRLWLESSSLSAQADVVVDGDFAHVLLYEGASNSKFITLEYVSGAYQIKNPPGLVNLTSLGSSVETATIDIDSNNKIWLAWESSGNIKVRWSSPPYDTDDWSSDISIGTTSGNGGDDIGAVTAFGGNKIGVLWSNQDAKEFQFRYRFDNNNEDVWQDMEVAASGSTPGAGVADDHINFAVHSNGTIYAAIKTSYDTNGEPAVALLVRSSGGTWQFVDVRYMNSGKIPTRPIALLNENVGTGILTVVYTQHTSGDDIMYKSSYISLLSFDPGVNGEVLIENVPIDWNNVTSTKQNFDSEVVILASSYDFGLDQTWTSVIASGITPTPVELAYFAGTLNDNKVELNWLTETEVSNYGFDIERLVENSGWVKLGFVEGHGNSNSPKEYSFADYDISRAGQYKYRLKQIDNDGKFEYSYVITVYVGAPAAFYLSQNYPNPFNPSTKIDYSVPEGSKVNLKVYDILGREVASLVDEYKDIGTFTVTLDASNLPGGIYFYTISAGGFVETKKMSLVK
jgi:hypothetical protein